MLVLRCVSCCGEQCVGVSVSNWHGEKWMHVLEGQAKGRREEGREGGRRRCETIYSIDV